jgi:hypothetical protein
MPKVLLLVRDCELVAYVKSTDAALFAECGVMLSDHLDATELWPNVVDIVAGNGYARWAYALDEVTRDPRRYLAFYDTPGRGRFPCSAMTAVIGKPTQNAENETVCLNTS